MVGKELGVPRISTGDILREAMEKETPLGEKAADYVEGGRLVPDDIVLSLVSERTSEDDCSAGFILDGFPRTLVQAEGLSKMLKGRDQFLDAVLFLDVSDDVIVTRLSRRRTCPGCGAPYNLDADAPEADGICDRCGRKLEARVDDDPATVRVRLDVYRKDTLPLVEYYESEGLLRKIDGEGTVEEVFSAIMEELESIES
jgi:adenylate kinase